ncbi:hypothetical protein AY599_02810 [Leptolyngbya valderiana BDU 20041]|nr:hypothetical protein AY599_02810 [Leptolyngbya valderiana BDU 20041]
MSFSIPSTDSPPGEPAKSDRTDTFTSSQRSELSGIVRFEPPPESPPAPPESGGGGSRGIVHFEPPPEEPAAPGESGGGGSRYRWEFEPPDEDAPEESGSGASRSENEFAVSSQDSESQLVSLTPLVPETHYGRTVAARPSFFVYVPETVARQMFFSLHEYVATDNETVDRFPHYQGVLSISGCEGIVQLTLPSEARELELGKNYQWYVAVVTSDRLRPDSPSTSGWVRRVPQSPDWESLASKENSLDLAATYGRSGIWYDALEVLAALRQARPHSNVLATEWRDLLAQVGLEAIADRPFVDSTSVSSTHECGNG